MTNMAWENMRGARAWPSPHPPMAWSFQQLRNVAKSVFQQPLHATRTEALPKGRRNLQAWQQREAQFSNSVHSVPSHQNRYEHSESWVTQDWVQREHGVIKHWNYDKGYGFIKPSDGSKKVYCHARDLVDGSVEKGDHVTYGKVFEASRGDWRCVDVGVTRGDERVERERKSGTLKHWDSRRGFGFIQPSDGGNDIFCHFKDLLDFNVQIGDPVTYHEKLDRSGKSRCGEVSLSMYA